MDFSWGFQVSLSSGRRSRKRRVMGACVSNSASMDWARDGAADWVATASATGMGMILLGELALGMRFAGGHNCIQFFRPLKRAPAFGLDSSPQACAWGYLLAPAHAGTVYGLDCSAY